MKKVLLPLVLLVFILSACGRKNSISEAEDYILKVVSAQGTEAYPGESMLPFFDRYGVVNMQLAFDGEPVEKYVWGLHNGTFYVFNAAASGKSVTIGSGDNLKSAFFSFYKEYSGADLSWYYIFEVDASDGEERVIYRPYWADENTERPVATEKPVPTEAPGPEVTEMPTVTTEVVIAPAYEDFSDVSERGSGESLFTELTVFDELDRYERIAEVAAVIRSQTAGGVYGTVPSDSEMITRIHDDVQSLSDLLLYFVLASYRPGEDDRGLLASVKEGWDMIGKAQLTLSYNMGFPGSVSTILAYLLEDDYDEIGFVVADGKWCSQFNYIRQGDTYYLVDFSPLIEQRVWTDGIIDVAFFNDFIEKNRDSLCFWSGKSLTEKSCVKAALLHSTIKDGVRVPEFDYDTALNNLGAVYAEKYYSGMDGVKISVLHDFCYNSSRYTDREGEYLEAIDSFDIYFPEYTEGHILWLNNTGRFLGREWKFGGFIPVKLVPWYADMSPEARSHDTEQIMEKTVRQQNWQDINNIISSSCMEVGKRVKATLMLEHGMSVDEIKNYLAK